MKENKLQLITQKYNHKKYYKWLFANKLNKID